MNLRHSLALALVAVSLALLWLAFSQQATTPQPTINSGSTNYQDRDWSEPQQNSLNLSVYIYRDRNRNGSYDIGDLPMASIAVDLTRPDGSRRGQLSNINGFTNFKMSYQADGFDIHQTDQDYSFEVRIPPGWTATTDNIRQISRFKHVPGSVAGMAAIAPPTAVGLAPALTVSGTVQRPGPDGKTPDQNAIRLYAVNPQGHPLPLVLDDAGIFEFEAEIGSWRVVAEHLHSGEILSREFLVADTPVQLASLIFDRQQSKPMLQIVKQDFEYLTRSPISKIPGGHLGLDWNYLIAVDNQLYNAPGFVNILMSGKNAGYNSSGHPVTITPALAGQYFDFGGAYFGVAWPQAEGETLLIKAWRGETVVAQEQIPLSYLGPIWFDADFRKIDKLTLTTAHYWQFVADDMLFRIDSFMPQPVDGPLNGTNTGN